MKSSGTSKSWAVNTIVVSGKGGSRVSDVFGTGEKVRSLSRIATDSSGANTGPGSILWEGLFSLVSGSAREETRYQSKYEKSAANGWELIDVDQFWSLEVTEGRILKDLQ